MNALRIPVTTPTSHTLPSSASAFLALMAMKEKSQTARIQTIPVAVDKFDDSFPQIARRVAVRSLDRSTGFIF